MASIRLFSGIIHVLPIVSTEKKRLAVIPLSEEESSSVEWSRKKKDGEWVNKSITSLEFVEKLYSMMEWKRDCRYKILGRVANSPRGIILVFDLSEAIMFTRNDAEFVDPDTGETKKRKIVYYPDEYKGRIGKSYKDYMEYQHASMYDRYEDLTGNTYNDAPLEDTIAMSGQEG